MNGAPAFLGFLVQIPSNHAKVLRKIIADWHCYLNTNPHGGHVHRLIKPSMMSYAHNQSMPVCENDTLTVDTAAL